MTVDTKEHLERRIADSLACGKYLDAAEYITLLAELIAEREPAQPEPAAEINDAAALRKLVRHCWVHSVYPDCGYDQMDSAMKRLYDAVRKREPDADDKPEPAAEAERDELESIVNRFCEDVLAWSKAGQKDDDLPFPLRVRGSSAGEEWTMHNLPLVLASPVACLKERYRAEKGKVQQ